MIVHKEHLQIRSAGTGFTNLTTRLHEVVAASRVQTGLLTVFVLSHLGEVCSFRRTSIRRFCVIGSASSVNSLPTERRWERHDDRGLTTCLLPSGVR